MATKNRPFRHYLQNQNLRSANSEMQYTEEMVSERIKCIQDPIYFIENYVKIINLDKGFVNIELYDFQKEMIKSFLDNRFTIAMFTRQSGKSVAYVCYILWTLLFTSDQNIAIFAHKFSVAKDILQKVRLAYEALPLWMQQGVKTWNKNCIELENNSRVVASSTSGSAGRSGSYNIIILDEYAFVPRNIADDFMASVYPTISSGEKTKCIMVSTPNGMNHFYKFWIDAQQKRNLYIPITAPWNCRPGRDEKWLEEQRKQLGDRRFTAEVLCKFIGSSGTLISGAKLESMIWVEPSQDNTINDLYYYSEIKENRKYVISVDTSEGLGLDNHAFTVIDISDRKKYDVIAKYKNNETSIEEYARILNSVARKYNDAHILIEVNNIGYAVADLLYTSYEYENIYCTAKSSTSKRNSQQASLYYSNGTKLGFKTSKSTKSIGCSTLKTLIENDIIEIKDYDIVSELSNFIRRNDSYSADDGYNDDLTMTLVNFAWLTTQSIFLEQLSGDITVTETETDSSNKVLQIVKNDGISDHDEEAEMIKWLRRL